MIAQTTVRRLGRGVHPTLRRVWALPTSHNSCSLPHSYEDNQIQNIRPLSKIRLQNPRMISHDLFSRWFASDSDDTVVSTTSSDDVEQEHIMEHEDDGQYYEQYLSEGSTLIEPNTKSHTQKTLDNLPITFADISRAEVAIRGGVKRTTCEKSHFISELCGTNVYFKNEFRQFTGSFKERGARNAILKLIRDKGPSLRGVIAASAGNHALAIAFHGQQLGIPVTVVMPTTAPLAKVDKCRVR
jgi:Pyridoxal-phosphate dependent enzyme